MYEKTTSERQRNALRNSVSEIIEELYFSLKPSRFLRPLKKAAEESPQRAVINGQTQWCRTDSTRDTRERMKKRGQGKSTYLGSLDVGGHAKPQAKPTVFFGVTKNSHIIESCINSKLAFDKCGKTVQWRNYHFEKLVSNTCGNPEWTPAQRA